MSILETYNLEATNVVSSIKSVLSFNGRFYAGVRLRCVLSIRNGEWSNNICVARAFTNEELSKRQATKGMKYRGTYLWERWIKPEELESFVNEISGGKLVTDDGQIDLGGNSKAWRRNQLPSKNEYMTYPGYIYELQLSKPSGSHERPLLDYKFPYYSDVFEALRHWVEIKDFHGSNDARLGSVLVILPECRAYFAKVTMDKGKLKVALSLEKKQMSSLVVKGLWSYESSIKHFQCKASKAEVEIDMPPEPDRLEFWLIGSDNTVYDFRQESRYWSAGQERFLVSQYEEKDDLKAVQEAVKKGEGPNIEFKPFIEVKDKKVRELVRTVIAFANTSGGMIIIGVDDTCVITGVEKDIRKFIGKSKRDLEQSYTTYLGGLRQAINRVINKALELEFKKVRVNNETVILIRVPEGRDKPYFDVQTNEIFVRRGANNVRADPKYDLPKLYGKKL